METLLVIGYATYLILVGVQGNAKQLVTNLQKEGQFISWVIIITAAAMFGDMLGKNVGQLFLLLVLTAFLLNSNNQSQFIGNVSKFYNQYAKVSK